MSREVDIALFGATGYTGKLVAEYLRDRKSPLKIALAGRDAKKLVALGMDLPIEICDALKDEDVRALARKARVICTTVGPYLEYGERLAAACAEHGTDYCDLTGETPFMKRSIDRNHEVARRTGARLLHACGFDSIPSDLGVFATWRAAGQKKLVRVRNRLVRARGKPSGGTAASALAIAKRIREPGVRRALADTHALDPEPSAHEDRDRFTPARDPETGHWLGPFFMAPVNTRVVRRTHGLLERAYGERFTYEEVMDLGPGFAGFQRALKMSAVMIGVPLLAAAPSLAKRFFPKPGEGPTPEERARGYFRMELDAETEDGARLRTTVGDDLDPGYGSTAKMLGETALCLAELESAVGGVLTPAFALGDALLARLRSAGMIFASEWR